MFTRKRKKIFYVPMLASLLSLPFLLFQFDPIPASQRVLRLMIPSDETDKKADYYRFSSQSIKEIIKHKKKLHIYLEDNHLLNKQKLELIKIDAQRLQYYGDTTTVLLVHFNDDVQYGEFVALINILANSFIKRYAWVDDYMVIFGGS